MDVTPFLFGHPELSETPSGGNIIDQQGLGFRVRV